MVKYSTKLNHYQRYKKTSGKLEKNISILLNLVDDTIII